MYSGKMEKKFGNKIGNNHYSHATSSPHRTKSSNSLLGFIGTTLSIEVMEVRAASGSNIALVGGPYVCILEVIDSSIRQTVWKQKSSAQFTHKPPIIFGDVFKVKNFSGEFGLDIRPGFVLNVQFCKVNDKAPTEIDSAAIELEDLVVNKEQQLTTTLKGGKAIVVLRLTLSNTQYPRANTLTLNQIYQKEREKEKTIENVQVEDKGITRSDSVYSLPRLTVKFAIHYHTVPGEEVRVVGSNYKIGDWDAFKAPALSWTEGGLWVLEVSFRKAFVPFEYKYVVIKDGQARWETLTQNRRVESTEEDFVYRADTWEKLE